MPVAALALVLLLFTTKKLLPLEFGCFLCRKAAPAKENDLALNTVNKLK